MELAATLLLIVCYGAAGYLAWAQRTPIYLLAIVAGHLGALASPLWRVLYGIRYDLDLPTVQTLLGQPVPWPVLLGAGWYYTLPAMVVFFLFSTRWWFPGPITGVLTYMIFLLYHLLIEAVGLRSQTWAYGDADLPLGFSAPLLAALMAGLISYGVLYTLLAVHRFAWPSMAVAVLPSVLVISLLVYGLLGAPLWLALLLDGQAWAVLVALVTSVGLLVWAGQIITGGISRLSTP
ncbi:MAG TPA: hypothetical protein PKD53_20975 [Chloroflexaceae bacterium]|nr:hypothetical protein [Chloroflexaceae bacterium]